MKPDASHGKAIPIRGPLQQLFSYIGIGTGGGGHPGHVPPPSQVFINCSLLCVVSNCAPQSKSLSYATELAMKLLSLFIGLYCTISKGPA